MSSLTLRYKLLIFDWDGTLMDSEARIVESLRHASKEILNSESKSDDEFKNVIGLSLREALLKLHPGTDDPAIQKMAESYKFHYTKTSEVPSVLFDGTRNILESLKEKGHLLAIATGKGRPGLDQVLEHTGLTSHFHITNCASETLSKPNPVMLTEILDSLQIDVEHALMIGDTEYDMEMAKNAGMDRMAVSYGVHSIDRLMKYDPVGCLNDIKELPGYLDEMRF